MTRSTPTGTFGSVTSLSVNQLYIDRDPFFAPGQSALFFAREQSSAVDLYSSTYSGGTFATPVILANVNHPTTEDRKPVLSRDGLRLYFKGRRLAVSHPNVNSDGDGDIYLAERTSTSASFGTPTLISILNSTGIDFPTAISADGCSLFVGSNRHTGNSDQEVFRIYEARRGTPPQNVTITMKNVNVAPTAPAGTANVNEGTADATTVLTLATTDADGQTIGYTFTATGTATSADGKFKIVGNTIVTNGAVGAVTADTPITYAITANDGSGAANATASGNVTITVKNMNVAPTAPSGSPIPNTG